MHKYIGGDLLVRGQGEQAMEHYNAALLSDRKRAEADPNNAQAQLDVTFDVRDMGSYYEDHGKLDVALENFHRAAEIRARLLQLDPANHTLQGRVVYIDLRLAGALLRTGNSVESLRYYRSAAKIAETRYAKDPDEVTNRGYLAFAYERVGFIQNVQATSATDGEKQKVQSAGVRLISSLLRGASPQFRLIPYGSFAVAGDEGAAHQNGKGASHPLFGRAMRANDDDAFPDCSTAFQSVFPDDR